MTTPLLGLSEIAEGVANQTTIHNTALRQWEARSIRALSMITLAPPAAVEGDSYIIPSGATGAWSGKTGQIASFIGGAWSYVTPIEGVRLWINDLAAEYVYDGAAWIANGGDASADIAAAIDAHEAASNPHPGYLTQAEADALYSPTGSGETTTTIGAIINGATGKTTPVDADYIGLMDSAASNVLKKLSWANVKATLKAYFDTLYAPLSQPLVVVPFYPGVPTASALMCLFPAPAGITTLTFAAALAGSSGKALVAATAQTDFDVRKNATSTSTGTSVGTMRFAAAGTVPTFIAASGFTLTGGTDWLTMWAPATPDATLANISGALYCARS
jgi:hypothetical protein